MKLFVCIVPIIVAVGLASAGAPSSPPTPDTYIWVKYKDGAERFFKFGECYPYEIHGALAEQAVWLQSATCYDKEAPDCSGSTVPPVGVPIPRGFTLVNLADFVQDLGQAAVCYKDALPGIPVLPSVGL